MLLIIKFDLYISASLLQPITIQLINTENNNLPILPFTSFPAGAAKQK